MKQEFLLKAELTVLGVYNRKVDRRYKDGMAPSSTMHYFVTLFFPQIERHITQAGPYLEKDEAEDMFVKIRNEWMQKGI